MTDHLPECPWPDEPCGHEPMHDRQPLFCVACLTECDCERLRACEQRVREDERCHLEQPRYDMMLAMLYRLGGRVHLTAAEILAMDTSVMVRVSNDPSDLSCVIEVLREEQK